MPDDNVLGSIPNPDQNPPNVGAGTNPPPTLAPQEQPPQNQPQPNPQAAANLADVAHHAGIGKMFRSLMGNDVNYSVNPQTGEMVTTTTPKSGSGIWRGILAGALLGGQVAAQDKAEGFLQGAAEGGGAEIQDQRKQDLLKRQQARDQFKDQLEARKSGDEHDESVKKQQLAQAQIAFHNAQTLRENQLIQHEDYDFHEKAAATGRTQIQPFITAGVPYAFKDISEAQLPDILKNNPDSAKLLWEPTGTRVIIGADGKPNVEATYSAINPTGKIKITDAQLKQWKDAGLDQYFGSQWSVLKNGKELDASQYMAITQKEQELTNQKVTRQKQQLELDKDKAQIEFSKANTQHLRAETAKLIDDEKDKKLLDEAFSLLSSGGDVSKLSAKQRQLMSKGITEVMGTIQKQIHELPKGVDGQTPQDQPRAAELYKDWDNYGRILNKLYGVKDEQSQTTPTGGKPGADSEPVQNIGELMQQDNIQVGGIDAYDYISNRQGISNADKATAIKKYALVPWSTVVTRAEQEGITKKKMFEKLKSQGFKVQEDPSEDMSLLPVGAG